MPHVPVLLGTTREGRRSALVAELVLDRIRAAGATTVLLDPADPPLPVLEERRRRLDPVPDAIERFGQGLEDADGLVIVSPEYNWGIPGPLKNALDLFLPELSRRPVGLVGVSAGSGGGRIAVHELRSVLLAMGALPVPRAALVARVNDLVDGDRIDDAVLTGHLDNVIAEVLWWVDAARLKREAGD